MLKQSLKENSGSVLVGVMVSMVFIGIVTTAMLKSTGSQYSAAADYGSVTVMESTVKSGVIASESYFINLGNQTQVMQMLNTLKTNPSDANQFAYGTQTDRISFANEQFFRSRVKNFNINNGQYFVNFDVDAGKRAKGKALRNALGFYEVTGIEIKTTPVIATGGNNAFYMGGGVMTATATNFKVEGRATFANSTQEQVLNTQSGLTFEKKDGVGDVYFNGPVQIMHQLVKFRSKVFFKGAINFNISESTAGPVSSNPGPFNILEDDVGFFSDVTTGDRKIGIGGNIWMKGSVRNNAQLVGDNTKTLYHAGTSPIFIPGSCAMVNGSCTVHGVGGYPHINAPPEGGVLAHCQGHITNFTITNPNPSMNENTIITAMDICPFEKRKEVSKRLNTTALGSFYSIGSIAGSASFTGDSLTKFIQAIRNSPDNGNNQYFYPKDRKDPNAYFLVNLNASVDWNGGTFNEKVVFNMTASQAFKYKFYNSSSDASTVIYAGSGANCIRNFSIDKNAAEYSFFRGLIYTHNDNGCTSSSSPHEFNHGVGVGSSHLTVDGAITINGGNFVSHIPNLTVRDNKDLIRRIDAMFVCDETIPANCNKENCDPPPQQQQPEEEKVSVIDSTAGVSLLPMGFYFY